MRVLSHILGRSNDRRLTPEDNFILSWCQLALGTNYDPVPEVPSTSEWERIYVQARSHGVAPLLYRTLIADGVLADQQIVERFKTSYYQAFAQALFFHEEVKKISASLKPTKTPVMLLKGAYLAHSVYPDPGCRPMSDLDLLVPRDGLDVVEQTLVDLGYTRAFHSRAHNLAHDCVLPYTLRRDKRKKIEIHWDLAPPIGRTDNIKLSEIWQQAIVDRIAGYEALVMRPEDQLIFACAHLASDKHCFDRLIWFCDICAIVAKREISWSYVVARSGEFNARVAVYFALAFARELLRLDIPAHVLRELKPSTLRTMLFSATMGSRPVLDGVPNYRRSMSRYLIPDNLEQSAKMLERKLIPMREFVQADRFLTNCYRRVLSVSGTLIRGLRNIFQIVRNRQACDR